MSSFSKLFLWYDCKRSGYEQDAERRIAQLEAAVSERGKEVMILQAHTAAVMQAHADGLKVRIPLKALN